MPDDVDVDVKAALPDEPWEVEGEDRVEMRVRVDALEARRVVDEVGEDKVVRRLDDGSVDLALGVSSFASIRSWVLGLLDHATVIEPAAFREELVAWLDAVAAPAPPLPAEPRVPERTRVEPTRSRRRRAARRGARPAVVCVGCLALIGWLAQVGEAPIAEAAQRFGMSEKELVAELELAACCGTPPYTPDTLMEIEVSEHSVRAFLPAEYARPRRLTPAEGFAVAASARLLLAVPGSEDGALRRALAKLDAALGSREAVGLDVDAPAHLAVVREAADAGRAIEIDYLSGSRDELTTRTRGARAGRHHRRALVSRCLLPPRRRHAALPGRPDRCRAPAGAERHAGAHVVAAVGGDVRAGARCGRGAPAARTRARSGCPSPSRCAPCGGMPTGP